MLVRALYPFLSASRNELSIHATQRLALIEGGYNSQTGACWGDCGWVRVATLDGLIGADDLRIPIVVDTECIRSHES